MRETPERQGTVGIRSGTVCFPSSPTGRFATPLLSSLRYRYASDRRAKPSGPLWDDGRRQGAVKRRKKSGNGSEMKVEPRKSARISRRLPHGLG